MNNLSKILMVTCVISTSFINSSYGMFEDEKDSGNGRNPIQQNSAVPQVALDVESDEEDPTEVRSLTLSTRIKGYSLRCTTIGCATLIGGSIGYSVMIGEYGLSTATGLLRYSVPALIGSLAGYGVGWGFGNTIKAKITGRC